MRISKPETLTVMTRTLPWDQGFALCLSAYLAFSLDQPGGPVLLDEAGLWAALEQGLGQEEVFDPGLPKPRGEFLVHGQCAPPAGARAMEVQVRVGARTKRLVVFGRRVLRGGRPGDPEPLLAHPLDWEHAFGGPGFPRNPLGLGHGAADGDLLPTVLGPDDDLAVSRDRLAPAGLRAYPSHWPQRAALLGPATTERFLAGWPYWPRDTSLEFFCAAPEDQRLDGFFSGRETLSVSGMSPDGRTLNATLPGLRARLLVELVRDGQARLADLAVTADTLWLLPGQGVGVLCYRALAAGVDEDAETVSWVLAGLEPLDQPPRPLEHYQEVLAGLKPPEGGEAEPPRAGPSVPRPPRMETRAGAVDGRGLAGLGVRAAAAPEAVGAALSRAGLDRESSTAAGPPGGDGPYAGQDLRGADFTGRDLRGADFQGAVLAEADFSGADLSGADFTRAMLSGAALRGCRLARVVLVSCEAAGADFSAADLSGANLAGGGFDQAGFFRADLTGADLSGVSLAQADLEGATAVNLNGQAADFSRARCVGADFSGADLSYADFSRADLVRVRFVQARAVDAQFAGANCSEAVFARTLLDGARADRDTRMAGAVFQGASLLNVRLAGADLSGAVLEDCVLDGADLSGTVLEGTVIKRTQARGADLSKARLTRAGLFGVNLMEASLRKVQAEDSRLVQVNLYGADFYGARLVRLEWRAVNLDHTLLEGQHDA